MKYLPIVILLTVLLHIRNTQKEKGSFSGDRHITYLFQTDAKDRAFAVLRTKCNSCHATKKRTDVFTLENMDSLAADIHKQVFVKRKMPKGRKTKLTEEETRRLEVWLDATLNEK